MSEAPKSKDQIAAEAALSAALSSESGPSDGAAIAEETVSAEGVSVEGVNVPDSSGVALPRLVVFTTDITACIDGSDWNQRLREWDSLVAEVHVIVLNVLADGGCEPLRLSNTLWIHPTNSSHSVAAYFDAIRIVEQELVFTGQFRPDVVISLEPFLAGYVARTIAKRYQRPFQTYITQDIFSYEFQRRYAYWWCHRWMLGKVMSDVTTVSVSDRLLEEKVIATWPALSERVTITPRFVNAEPPVSYADELEARYPQYKLRVLFMGPLEEESGALTAAEAVSVIKNYPTIGVFFIGEGSKKEAIEQQVAGLGISEQVVVNPPGITEEMMLSCSHILLYPGGPSARQDVLLQAALAKIPIIAGRTPFVSEIFTDGEDALLCPADKPRCYQHYLAKLINDNTLRKRIARIAEQNITEKFSFDREVYLEAIQQQLLAAQYYYELPPTDEPTQSVQTAGERTTS